MNSADRGRYRPLARHEKLYEQLFCREPSEETIMKRELQKKTIAASIAALFAVGGGSAGAAGFALIEQGGSGMGNAYAGAAAVAEDASTVFFNPAGMSLLEGPQFAGAAHVIDVSAKFSGTATNPLALGGGAATGGSGGNAGDTAVVPNLYFAMPVGERLSVGVGVNVPFGLTTEYDANWIGRFQGIKSELVTTNINPSIAYRLTDAVSIGGGINYQRAEAELTNAIVLGAGQTGKTKLEADDDGWGWNLGALFQVTPATRIGVSYRSEIEYELDGSVTNSSDSGAPAAVAAANATSGPSRADIAFPDMFSISLAHAVSDRLQLLADATRMGWSSINEVRVINTTNGGVRDILVFDFDDAWRYSIGANYKWSDTWTLKAGLAYDETPVKGANSRTVRLPDNDRTWISLGGQLKIGQSGRLDLGYAHLFIKDAPIDFTKGQLNPGTTTVNPVTTTTVTGSYEGSVDIFSLQYTHSF
jgi:long-chain fatty acid transport protein